MFANSSNIAVFICFLIICFAVIDLCDSTPVSRFFGTNTFIFIIVN